MKFRPALIAAAALATVAALPVYAADDAWVLRVGAHVVNPESNNGQLAGANASITSDTKPTISLEYMWTQNWGVDLLGAVPFKHDVKLNGQRAATTKQLPPTLGVNYHFMPQATVSPFLGLGVNYTRFFDTNGVDSLKGDKVKIDNSWGAAAHAGVDFHLSDKWLLTADMRWMHIGGEVHVNGADVGNAKVNPFVFGVAVGYRF